jgi:hypothetical protein
MLASLLFPYDDDAAGLMDGWLTELEDEGCICRYVVDGSTYLEICKWSRHQRIDKPTPTRMPDPREGSRILARSRESSSEDMERDLGSRNSIEAAAAASPREEITAATSDLFAAQRTQPGPDPLAKHPGWPDLIAAHGRCYVPPTDRDGWDALLREYEWDPDDPGDPINTACRDLAAELGSGKRILLTAVSNYLAKHYRRKVAQ